MSTQDLSSSKNSNQNGDFTPEYWYQKGIEAYNAKNYSEAAKCFRLAADRGLAKAQYQMGYMYDFGYGVEKDYAFATKYYMVSAQQGYAPAQRNLGMMYLLGKGVEKDFYQAFNWFKKAAEQGNALAQYDLGGMYYRGDGVKKDVQTGIYWYQKSAEQGYAPAKESLGRISVKVYNQSRQSSDANKPYNSGEASNESSNYESAYEDSDNPIDETEYPISPDDYPETPRIIKPSFFLKALLFLIGVAAVVLIRRMDQLSYQPISEEQALEMAQEVTITTDDQQITLLDTDTLETHTLKKKSTVKVLGIYKEKLSKGKSPLDNDNPVYLIELPDGTRGYGPLAEASILPAEGDSVWQCVTYQARGLREDAFLTSSEGLSADSDTLSASSDSLASNSTFLQKAKKFFLYDIRPVTKKNGFFLFPKYQQWNEFHLPGWVRTLLLVLAYILEIILIYGLYNFINKLVTIHRAKRGNVKACRWMGICYEYNYWDAGWDIGTALKWFKISAEQNYGPSCLTLGGLYEGRHPNDGVEINYWTAHKYYEKGAAGRNRRSRKQCKEGLARVSEYLKMDNDFGKAYVMANSGSINYQNTLANYYASGYYADGIFVMKNPKEAIRWYRKSAEGGSAEAYYNLGQCYKTGDGVEIDFQEAIRMYKEAAEMGVTEAYGQIGYCYAVGLGMQNEAMYYYKEGAKHGDDYCLYNIGHHYYNGQGVPKDKDEAIRWFKQAARLGNAKAIEVLNNLGYSY